MTNLKLVLRTYSALRQMSPDDIALLETLRALNDNDRELLVEMMTDKPAAKKASKKSSKSSSSKSSRATGIERQLNKRREQGRVGTIINGDNDSYCAHQYEHDGIMVECGEPADQNIHHLRTVEGYHPFVSESGAPPALTPSPANDGAGSGTANLETQPEGAGSVAHGAGGGD